MSSHRIKWVLVLEDAPLYEPHGIIGIFAASSKGLALATAHAEANVKEEIIWLMEPKHTVEGAPIITRRFNDLELYCLPITRSKPQ